ncbi:MAG: DUF6101 family protein [Methylocystis sp.]|nr:DUF6101 family protein [Methylocystis sp.]
MFQGSNARKIEDGFITQRDRRADGGARRISVSRNEIVIARSCKGVPMKIRLPVSAYRGVALEVRGTAVGVITYLLTLAHRDSDLDILLAEVKEGDAVVTEWRYWAAWMGLPRLIIEDGETHEIESRAGLNAAAKTVIARRRVGALMKRRPRFLLRRKTGVMARTAENFAGEREIICYE